MTRFLKRPIVRYHGGKFRDANWIISHFPAHHGYTDSFGGGGSVLLKKPRSYFEVYNDLDSEIVNVFRCMRDHGEELKQHLRLTPFSREEFKQSYQVSDDPIEQARRSIYRSFAAFGSTGVSGKQTGFRANSNRSGTTPAHDWLHYPDHIDTIIDRLRGVVIENRDAIQVMKQHDGHETLHYVDPPYVHSTRNKSCAGKAYRHEMDDKQHYVLLQFLKTLSGMIIISGYDNQLYNDFLTGWTTVRKKTHADGGAKRVEVLWISPNCKSKTLF